MSIEVELAKPEVEVFLAEARQALWEYYVSDEEIDRITRAGHDVLHGVRYFQDAFAEESDSITKLRDIYLGSIAYGVTDAAGRSYQYLAKEGDKALLDDTLIQGLSLAIKSERKWGGQLRERHIRRLTHERNRLRDMHRKGIAWALRTMISVVE